MRQKWVSKPQRLSYTGIGLFGIGVVTLILIAVIYFTVSGGWLVMKTPSRQSPNREADRAVTQSN